MDIKKKCIIVIGLESTGTRIFSKLLTDKLMIDGKTSESGHSDILDNVWRGEMQIVKSNYILTRRSMPHGRGVDPAKFLDFPRIYLFCNLMGFLGHKVYSLITTRSPAANINSWVNKRASVGGKRDLAIKQYDACYKRIFESFISLSPERSVEYCILSLEGLILDRLNYVNGIYNVIGLPTVNKIHQEINKRS